MKAVLNTPDRPGTAHVADPYPVRRRGARCGAGLLDQPRRTRPAETRTNQWRPGQDVAGVVVEPTADGSGPPPGSRVVALVEEAGWTEPAPVPTARLAPVPDPVGFEQAAALPLAGLTALRTCASAATCSAGGYW
jgi:NADPH:quinone reductase